MKETRPHYFITTPEENPWSADNFSITAQGRYYREHGREAAERAAAAAGSSLGATKPPAAKANGDAMKGANNPWSRQNFDIPRQVAIIKALGTKKAQEIARAAGSYIGARAPA
jgi:hypothetical protein